MEITASKPLISVLLPTYNESQTIGYIIEDISKALKKNGLSNEIIVIDDGSIDLTGRAAVLSGAKVIRFQRSVGYNFALLAGLSKASGEIIVITDASGIYKPEEIARLVEPIRNGEADIVSGSRFVEQSDIRPNSLSLMGKIGSYLLGFIASLTYGFGKGIVVTDVLSEFKAISKEGLLKLDLKWEDSEIGFEILAQSIAKNLRFKEVPVTYRTRYRGTTVTLGDGFRLLRRMLRGSVYG